MFMCVCAHVGKAEKARMDFYPNALSRIKEATRYWRPTVPELSPEHEHVRFELRKRASGQLKHGQDFLDLFYYNPTFGTMESSVCLASI